VPLSQPKPKRCRVCRQQFQPRNSLQRVCGLKCSLEFARYDRVKAQRAKDRERKVKLKTRGDYTREAQAAVNAYVRARDAGRGCMACGNQWRGNGITGSGWDAGHYRSRGAAPHLRFHLLNIWRVCSRCNRELSGNIVEMRKGMVARLGEKRVQELEHDQRERKYSVEDLQRIKSLFNRRARHYRKLRNNSYG